MLEGNDALYYFLASKILCCFKGFYSVFQGHSLLPAVQNVLRCAYMKVCLYRCKHPHTGVTTQERQETSACGGF